MENYNDVYAINSNSDDDDDDDDDDDNAAADDDDEKVGQLVSQLVSVFSQVNHLEGGKRQQRRLQKKIIMMMMMMIMIMMMMICKRISMPTTTSTTNKTEGRRVLTGLIEHKDLLEATGADPGHLYVKRNT